MQMRSASSADPNPDASASQLTHLPGFLYCPSRNRFFPRGAAAAALEPGSSSSGVPEMAEAMADGKLAMMAEMRREMSLPRVLIERRRAGWKAAVWRAKKKGRCVGGWLGLWSVMVDFG